MRRRRMIHDRGKLHKIHMSVSSNKVVLAQLHFPVSFEAAGAQCSHWTQTLWPVDIQGSLQALCRQTCWRPARFHCKKNPLLFWAMRQHFGYHTITWVCMCILGLKWEITSLELLAWEIREHTGHEEAVKSRGWHQGWVQECLKVAITPGEHRSVQSVWLPAGECDTELYLNILCWYM